MPNGCWPENQVGTTTVLDAAIDAGCTGIDHVPSTAALLRPGGTIDHESPIGVTLGPYTQSKVDSERVARDRHEPAPRSPSSTRAASSGRTTRTSAKATRSSVRSCAVVPTWPRGRTQWVDVRDTADVVVAALDRPGRRYLVPGETVALPHETLRTVTGRRLPAARLPLKAMLPVLQLGYRTGWPFLPHAVEGARFIAIDTRVDYSATVDDLGISGRPLAESMRDTVRWLAMPDTSARAPPGRAAPLTQHAVWRQR